uniref:Uncharacterized protein n=1 Tax=Opuntia streptacantha TaxID=393608 RepID=A0A7C9CES3_OPUST
MVMVVVVVEGRLFLINQALDVTKLLHVAGDGDGALLIESILLLSLLEKPHEEWVVEVEHRHHKPVLFLLRLAHLYRQAPFGHRRSADTALGGTPVRPVQPHRRIKERETSERWKSRGFKEGAAVVLC